MLFQRRYDKQIERIKEQNEGSTRVADEENIQNILEKNDTLALILSALIIIVPAALLFLLIVSAIGFFFIVR